MERAAPQAGFPRPIRSGTRKNLQLPYTDGTAIAPFENMEAFLVGATLMGSLAAAFVLQRAALEAFFRAMDADRRVRR